MSAELRQHVPDDRCYWVWISAETLGAIDTPGLHRAIARSSPELDSAIRRGVPVERDGLHAALTILTGSDRESGVAACLVDRATVEEATVAGTLVLVPASLPEAIRARMSDTDLKIGACTDRFNLLTGEFEPPVMKRVRRQTFAAIVLAVGLSLLTAFVALERKAATWDRRAHDLTLATMRVHERSAPVGQASAAEAGGRGGTGSSERRADQELRRLRAAAAESLAHQPTEDAAAVLALVLGHWPVQTNKPGIELYISTQSIVVGPGGVSIAVSIPASADAEPLIAAMRTVPGWTLQQTQRSGGSATGSGNDARARMALRLIRNPDPVAPSSSPGGASRTPESTSREISPAIGGAS